MKHWQRLRARFPQTESKKQLFVVLALLALLPLLAALQYRWLGRVSDGEREYLKANLRNAAEQFSRDFDQELTRLFAALRDEPFLPETFTQSSEARYAAKFAQWQKNATHPQLVKSLLLTQSSDALLPESDEMQWQCLNTATTQFAPCQLAAELQPLLTEFETRRGNLRRALSGQEPLPPRRFPEGLLAELPALVFPLLQRPPGPEFQPAGNRARGNPGPDRFRTAFFNGVVVVFLDQDYLRQTLLPALVSRYFKRDAADYDIVITNRDHGRGTAPQVFFTSDAHGQTDIKKFAQADVAVGLFGIRTELWRELQRDRWSARNPAAASAPTKDATIAATPAMPFALPLPGIEEGGRWQLLVQHRSGSLAAAVATARRRNLLLSFGILLVLTASVVLLISSARRAERLAQLQMDFVAGVSHELRTPISVLDAAGYNLTNGHIKDNAQMVRYGTLIRQESRRLTEMVEQILEFAGAQAKRSYYELQPTDLKQVIAAALNAPLLSEHRFAVEMEMPATLPTVQADAAALRRALQNLVNNAVKYSGESHWLKLQAHADQTGNAVQITIHDRGMGISAAELPHVFEPFYRGSEARAAQIHGNGLGLSLVKNIIEAHGGQVSVTSVVGQGSAFTVWLPVHSV